VLTIATWNVNSIKARLPAVLDWLKTFSPDVVLLQEIKCIDENFPVLDFEAAGYKVAAHGQKTYNGVAILSKVGLADVTARLPGDETDEQARYLEAIVGQESNGIGIRVAAIYLPNGNPIGNPPNDPHEKFTYKLSWMDRLNTHAESLLRDGIPTVLGGDYNIIPKAEDCYDPAVWANDALARPESRNKFYTLQNQGWTDAFRARDTREGQYSFWDYQAGAWQKNNGIRIDFLMLSPSLADCLEDAGIDSEPRGKEKASDHTPVWCRLNIS